MSILTAVFIIFMLYPFRDGTMKKTQGNIRKKTKSIGLWLLKLPCILVCMIAGLVLAISTGKFIYQWKQFNGTTRLIVGLCTGIAYLGFFTWFYLWCRP